jgi:hypothetical protein
VVPEDSPSPAPTYPPICPPRSGQTCSDPLAVTLTDGLHVVQDYICLEPAAPHDNCPGESCRAQCGGPEDCHDRKWYNITLAFADWGAENAIWIGAKACGCDTTISAYEDCCTWTSTGSQCGGIIINEPAQGVGNVMIAIANRGGACCTGSDPGITSSEASSVAASICDCCFDVTLLAVPWSTPACPPTECCPPAVSPAPAVVAYALPPSPSPAPVVDASAVAYALPKSPLTGDASLEAAAVDAPSPISGDASLEAAAVDVPSPSPV